MSSKFRLPGRWLWLSLALFTELIATAAATGRQDRSAATARKLGDVFDQVVLRLQDPVDVELSPEENDKENSDIFTSSEGKDGSKGDADEMNNLDEMIEEDKADGRDESIGGAWITLSPSPLLIEPTASSFFVTDQPMESPTANYEWTATVPTLSPTPLPLPHAPSPALGPVPIDKPSRGLNPPVGSTPKPTMGIIVENSTGFFMTAQPTSSPTSSLFPSAAPQEATSHPSDFPTPYPSVGPSLSELTESPSLEPSQGIPLTPAMIQPAAVMIEFPTVNLTGFISSNSTGSNSRENSNRIDLAFSVGLLWNETEVLAIQQTAEGAMNWVLEEDAKVCVEGTMESDSKGPSGKNRKRKKQKVRLEETKVLPMGRQDDQSATRHVLWVQLSIAYSVVAKSQDDDEGPNNIFGATPLRDESVPAATSKHDSLESRARRIEEDAVHGLNSRIADGSLLDWLDDMDSRFVAVANLGNESEANITIVVPTPNVQSRLNVMIWGVKEIFGSIMFAVTLMGTVALCNTGYRRRQFMNMIEEQEGLMASQNGVEALLARSALPGQALNSKPRGGAMMVALPSEPEVDSVISRSHPPATMLHDSNLISRPLERILSLDSSTIV